MAIWLPTFKPAVRHDCAIQRLIVDDASADFDGSIGLSIALIVLRLPPPWTSLFRRVDIIVAHPKLYIIAITGWSGATTFERDLRRYVSKTKGWRFDSSGITDESTKLMISLPSIEWRAGSSMIDLERKLFAILELSYIPPELRNTG